MLHISKKALFRANILRWVGTFIIILYIPMVFFALPGQLVPLIVGGVIAVKGGLMRIDLYLCPKCGTRILRGGTAKDILSRRIPEECYMCGNAIQVVMDD